MTTDPKTPAGKADEASTKHPPEHPRISPEEIAALVAEEEGVPVEELPAEYREHVERFGPAEAEVDGVIYSVWLEENDEEEEAMTEQNEQTQEEQVMEQPKVHGNTRKAADMDGRSLSRRSPPPPGPGGDDPRVRDRAGRAHGG